MQITTVGLDLAKNTFHLVGLDANGHEVMKKQMSRAQVLRYFINRPPCLVGMEACAGAHYFARTLSRHGHTVKLIPPQYVKAYLRGQKNDYNDARAIGEAVRAPQMRFVAAKTVSQQDLQALARMRAGVLRSRTALVNRLRGLLGEYGIVAPKGVGTLRRALPELLEDAENGLSDRFRRLLRQGQQELSELDAHVATLTDELQDSAKQDERARRLQTIPGFGPIVAAVFAATLGDGGQYRRGREASAAVGLVPRQHSSGGKERLLGISKRGDRYLRSLLVHGARAVVVAAKAKDDPLSRWINRLRETRGMNKATVALANKLTRVGWAVLKHGNAYQPA
ncbi:MAG: IS110 family transposase [Chloroflexi bacterium]|nr:IS110 family transposase [Chloroflexota bacterium]